MDADHPPYAGMTVNERLSWAGTLRAFHAALAVRDRETAVKLLSEVELADQAESIVEATFANPEKYGLPPAPTSPV